MKVIGVLALVICAIKFSEVIFWPSIDLDCSLINDSKIIIISLNVFIVRSAYRMS